MIIPTVAKFLQDFVPQQESLLLIRKTLVLTSIKEEFSRDQRMPKD
jgi:hypothetical protein